MKNSYFNNRQKKSNNSLSQLLNAKTMQGIVLASLLLIIGVTQTFASAMTFTSKASTAWTTASTWTINSGSGHTYPIAGDGVTLASGFNVTLTANAACTSITFAASTASTTLAIGTYTLAVSGAVTMTAPGASGTNNITISSGTLSAAGIAISGSATSGRNCTITVSTTGTVTTTGAITFGTTAQSRLIFSAGGTLNINSGGSLAAAGAFTQGTSIVYFKGTSQTVPAYTYYNLDLSGALGTPTFTSSGSYTMKGAFTPKSATSPANNNTTFTFSGTSQTIPEFTFYNLNFTGITTPVLINGGTITIKNTFTAAGTPTVTGNTVAFTGSSQTIPAYTYNNLDISGATSPSFVGSGSYTIKGAFTPKNSTTPANNNTTITFQGSAYQQIPAFTFYNLTFNNTSASAPQLSLSGDVIVNGNLTLTQGILFTGNYNLTLASGISGTPGSTKMIITGCASDTKGYLIKTSCPSSFTFPIGPPVFSAEYTPLSLNNTTGSPDITTGVSTTIINPVSTPANIVNLQWTVLSSAASTSDITFQWNSGDEASNFVLAGGHSLVDIGAWNGTNYSVYTNKTVTDNGNGTYSVSVTGLTLPVTAGRCYFVIGAAGSIISCQPQPTITTTGTLAAVSYSAGSQTTSLVYSATINSPTSYSIDWTGIADQGSTSFSFQAGGGTLTGIAIPAGTGAGTYNGIITITNGTCSFTLPVSMTVTIPMDAGITNITVGSADCSDNHQLSFTIKNYSTSPLSYVWVNLTGDASQSFDVSPSPAIAADGGTQVYTTSVSFVASSSLTATTSYPNDPTHTSDADGNHSNDAYTISSFINNTVTVGTGGTYSTFSGTSGLFNAINTNGLCGNLYVNVISDITETAIATLTVGSSYHIYITPASNTNYTISGISGTTMFDFNGASNVVIDGSYWASGYGNGTSDGNQWLNFTSSNIAGYPVIKFENNSHDITLKYCKLDLTGNYNRHIIQFISTGSDFDGNHNITIDHNYMVPSQASGYIIRSEGSDTKPNYNNTITYNSISNFESGHAAGSGFAIDIESIGNGGGWNISNNSIYNASTMAGGQTAIWFKPGAGDDGNTISNNYIGGSGPLCTGTWTNSFVSAAGNSLIAIECGTITFSGNTIKNISLNANYDIVLFTYSTNATITSNTINNVSTANDFNSLNGLNISTNSSSSCSITDNSISNISLINNGGNVYGIYQEGTGIITITGNRITGLSKTITTTGSVCGIYILSGTSNLIDNNTIHGLTSNSSKYAVYVNNGSGSISRNTIYDIANSVTVIVPAAYGIYLGGSGTWSVANNELYLNSTIVHDIYGIEDEMTSGATLNCYYNSILIDGTQPSGSYNTYAFRRYPGGGGTVAGSTISLKNNIFMNNRSGGAGSHYAIANKGTSNYETNWAAGASDYNFLSSLNSATLGLWGGTNYTFAGWQGISTYTPDLHSQNATSANSGSSSSTVCNFNELFNPPTTANLHILTTVPAAYAFVSNKGTPVGTTTDIDLETRDGSAPDIGVDEFSSGCINVSIASANAGDSPICNSNTTSLTANEVTGTNAVLRWWTGPGGTGTQLGTDNQNPLTGQGQGTYYARVTGDCGAPVEAPVTVTAKANVAITGITPDDNPICSSGTTNLTATGVAGTNAVVDWYSQTNHGGTHYGTGSTLNNKGTGTYYTYVTGDCGTPAEASITITAKTNVAITGITPDDNPICSSGTTNLTATGVAGTNAVVDWYSQTNVGGTHYGTGSTLNNKGTGTYYAYVTGDCGTPAEASITITAKTNVAITGITPDDNPICSSGTTNLTATGVAGTNAFVDWYSQTNHGGTHYGTGSTLNNKGTGTYYAYVTGDCGTPAEASITITAKTNVAITGITPDDNPICSSGTTNLTATGVAGTNAVVDWYSQTNGGGTHYGTGSTLNNKGTGTYYAYVTGDCGTPAEASITITAKTNVAITGITPDDNPICSSATTTLHANNVTGDGAVVNWYSQTNHGGTHYGTGLSLNNKGTGTYYAYVTGDCGTPAEASITITAKTNVAITGITPDDNPICSSATTTLHANNVTGDGAVVNWYSQTGGGGTHYGTGLSLSNAAVGTYYARVTGDCGVPAEASVTVNAASVATITGPTTECEGNARVPYYTESGKTGYVWSVTGGGTITSGSGTSSIEVRWFVPGIDTLSVSYTSGGCSLSASIYVTITPNAAIINQPSNAAVSAGKNTSFSVVAANSADVTYQWQVQYLGTGSWYDITGLETNPVYTGKNDSLLILTGVVTGNSTNKYRCIVSPVIPCTNVTSNAGILTVNPSGTPGLWVGGTPGSSRTQTEWNVKTNWDGNEVPKSGQDVTIPSSAVYQPIIYADSTGICKNIIINPKASLTVNSGGTFAAEGNMIIKSDATGTGGFKQLNGANVSIPGTIEVQRYIQILGYHYISSPLSGVLCKNGIIGFTNNLFHPCEYYNPDLPFPASAFPNMYRINEAHTHNVTSDYNSWKVPCLTETMDPMIGYAINIPASGTISITKSGSFLNEGDYPYTVSKEHLSTDTYHNNKKINEYGQIDLTNGINYGTGPSNGWHLVGNPYPSPVDWKALVNDNIHSGVGGTIGYGISFFKPTSQYYGIYGSYFYNKVVTQTSGAFPPSRYIPSMQSFFIRNSAGDVDDTPVLTFANSYRDVSSSALSGNFYKKFVDQSSEFGVDSIPTIALYGYKADFNEIKDKAVIMFDSEFKLDKLMNTDPRVPNIYSLSSDFGVRNSENGLSLQGINEIKDGMVIPLGFYVNTSGKYIINASEILNLPASIHVYLEDLKEKTSQDLTVRPSYSFAINKGEENNRFFLKFVVRSSGLGDKNNSEMFDAYTNNNTLFVNYMSGENGVVNSEEAVLSIFSITGQKAMADIKIHSDSYHINLNVAAGTYFVRLVIKEHVYIKKVYIN